MMKSLFFISILISLIFGSAAYAQHNSEKEIDTYLKKNFQEIGLTKDDITDWTITDQNTSKQNGITHIYLRQNYKGIPIENAVANFAIKDGKVMLTGNRLAANLSTYAKYSAPALNPEDAIKAAAYLLNLKSPENLKVLEPISTQQFIYNKGAISKENIPVQLMYYAVSSTDIRLVWSLSIYTLDARHWWSVQIDAHTGDLIAKNDWVVACNFDQSPFSRCENSCHTVNLPESKMLAKPMANPDEYTVFELPNESPNHGPISTAINPANAVASSFGWHDTDGIAGAEFTITRGNNVFAYEDIDNDDLPGFSPDGGPLLSFNFPYSPTNTPLANQSTAITNLFYMNNMMHDIWYNHGFDEVSGNFQFNNYGNGGLGVDHVFAEAQDGGGTNNANFATPADGSNPRMQMYLWNSGSGGNYLEVNSPAGIAGTYAAADATFGPGLPAIPITAAVELVIDNTAPVNDGCETIVNSAQLAGKIALIDRGSCAFTIKVEAAQNAGAVAVIIVNNVPGAPMQMGGTSGLITIPSVMISQSDGNIIKAQLGLDTVIATISNGGGVSIEKDGDLDNGIIAHEYGHGISNRLTGGPANSNCLGNSEQMGEGWSDWFGLMLTIEPGDQGTDIRGMGTFAIGEPVTGNGIRPAPYSTDFAINNFTYAASNNTGQISEPHGVGFIFATVLWDLNWALIAQYGGVPDPDLYNGSGGNNIAMKLIIEGLKLQPCSPGMIDGRDAILLADQLLYGGIHKCLIWNVFANRGFGYSANQGSANSRSDQTEAFDLPPSCLIATAPPIAIIASGNYSGCVTTINFLDSSYSTPQTWFWDFGDGSNSTLQNPTHTYTASGVYTVKLVVTNNLGSDSTTQQVNIALPAAPVTPDVNVCAGDTAFISTTVTGVAQWKNTSNAVIQSGNVLVVPNVIAAQTYYVENLVGTPSQFFGPVNTTIGGGGYHSSPYHGAINFTANKSLEIVSAWVDASGAGPRTIYLATGINSNGNPPTGLQIVDQVTVNLVNGPQRVYLNLMVPDSGKFNIGGNNVDLYRNNSGANYPYSLAGYMTLDNSSATNGATSFYYYFYDLEVRDPQCISALDTVVVTPIVNDFSFVINGNSVAFTDASIAATSWLWTFGDGNTSTLQNPTHIYASTGSYTVTLSINGSTCSKAYTINIGTAGIGEITGNNLQFSLSPNPSNTETILQLNNKLENSSNLFIYSSEGKQVRSTKLEAGIKEVTISLQGLAPQLYYVVLRTKDGEIRRKLFVY